MKIAVIGHVRFPIARPYKDTDEDQAIDNGFCTHD